MKLAKKILEMSTETILEGKVDKKAIRAIEIAIEDALSDNLIDSLNFQELLPEKDTRDKVLQELGLLSVSVSGAFSKLLSKMK